MFLFWVSLAAASEDWRSPPIEILNVLRAPEIPTAAPNPAGTALLELTPVRYPPLAERAAPLLKLAGTRVDPLRFAPHAVNGSVAPRWIDVDDGEVHPMTLPSDARVLEVHWTADGERLALAIRTDDHIGVWVGSRGEDLSEIPGIRLMTWMGNGLGWSPDQHRLIVKIPAGTGSPPQVPAVPEGPIVRSASGASRASTYEARDLLLNQADEDAFSWYGTSAIHVLERTESGAWTEHPVGEPGVYGQVEPSPDGRYLLVERLTPPWSTSVTWNRFPRNLEVWDLSDGSVTTVAAVPLQDHVPTHGVAEGARNVRWVPTRPAELCWVEALDNGDPSIKRPARDRILTLVAPFHQAATERLRTTHRFQGLWFSKRGLAIVEEYERERRWRHVWTLNFDVGMSSRKALFDLSVNDAYADPGSPLMEALPNGKWVLKQDRDDLYFSGAGSSPTGDRPFIDRRSLRTGKAERLFRSAPEAYERPLMGMPDRSGAFLVVRETANEPPHVVAVTPKGRRAAPAGEAVFTTVSRPITSYDDPAPTVRSLTKRLVTFQREDGTPLSFLLVLPPGYEAGTPLPTVLYAYPREFSDPATAGQVTGSERTFDRMIGPSHLYFALRGYAVLHNTTMPVVGDADTAYESFVPQMIANAQAAIDEAVRLGVTDPKRIGIMGHSHGGLMTATLLARSDLFRAGIARSGAYNHTIRPFGFQNERRSLWDASATYLDLSTVMHAPTLKEPILIIHGAMDENPGTLPFQSERLFEAVRGTGGTARLVLLPHEGHAYLARESVEQVLAEQIDWFDLYLR